MGNSSREDLLLVHRAPVEKLLAFWKNHPNELPLVVADAIDSLGWSYAKFDPYSALTEGQARMKYFKKIKATKRVK